MRFEAVSDTGKRRSVNEDNFLVNDKINFFMVADGMGGYAAGEVASQTAVDSAADFNFDLSAPLKSLSQLIFEINQAIINKSKLNSDYSEMGTTFTAAIVKDNKLYYVNLGDSRIYLYSVKNNKLTKISKDHSLVADLVREGKITEEEAFNHPKKNIVTQALGLDTALNLNKGSLPVNTDNYLLLCTDGLTDMVREKEIEKVFKNNSDLDKISERLLAQALASGGLDNITLIVADFNEE